MYHPKQWGRAQIAWNYIWQMLGVQYGWWVSGDVPAGQPAWADNSPAPSVQYVQARSMFCAAVGNLMIRALNMFDEGYVIPGQGDLRYDGGTVGWVAYYSSYGTLQPFDEEFAKTHSGTVMLREFRDASGDQGHWAVSWNGWTLQTFPPNGCNWDFTVEQSHDGGYYEYMVAPWDWLPFTEEEYYAWCEDGGEVDPTPAGGSELTKEMLVRAMTSNSFSGPDLDPAKADRFFPSIVKYCEKYEIDTRERFSSWLGQLGAESGSFEWWSEFGEGGGRFGEYYGSGPGQMTWEDTFKAFAQATGWDAWNHPELVRDDEHPDCGFESACWLWVEKGLNELADEATWPAYYETTHRWWGVEPQPVAERDWRYQTAWDALPADFHLPSAVEEPVEPEEPAEPVWKEGDPWVGFVPPNEQGISWAGGMNIPGGAWIEFPKYGDGKRYGVLHIPGEEEE